MITVMEWVCMARCGGC